MSENDHTSSSPAASDAPPAPSSGRVQRLTIIMGVVAGLLLILVVAAVLIVVDSEADDARADEQAKIVARADRNAKITVKFAAREKCARDWQEEDRALQKKRDAAFDDLVRGLAERNPLATEDAVVRLDAADDALDMFGSVADHIDAECPKVPEL